MNTSLPINSDTTSNTAPPSDASREAHHTAVEQQDKVQHARLRFASICGLHQVAHDPDTGFQAFGDGGKKLAIFGGKRTKADTYYTYRDASQAAEHLARARDTFAKSKASKEAAREAEAAKPCPLKVGDVLMASWGYEQTNIDFYQVTARTGKRSVTLREIASQSETDAWEQGTCIPAVGHFVGEPFTTRSNSRGSVTLASYKTAYPLEYVEVAGVRMYRASRWTSYY
ncbi:MAG: hypothetical protein ACYCSN_16645 [Acidobacteriaceae bacterium]